MFEGELAVDVSASNPATGVRSDLVGLLGDMFALVTSTPFEMSPRTLRAFSDEGANGRTAEGPFREISAGLGFSSAQTDRLLAGASLAEVGPPRPTVSGVRGAFKLLQVREAPLPASNRSSSLPLISRGTEFFDPPGVERGRWVGRSLAVKSWTPSSI